MKRRHTTIIYKHPTLHAKGKTPWCSCSSARLTLAAPNWNRQYSRLRDASHLHAQQRIQCPAGCVSTAGLTRSTVDSLAGSRPGRRVQPRGSGSKEIPYQTAALPPLLRERHHCATTQPPRATLDRSVPSLPDCPTRVVPSNAARRHGPADLATPPQLGITRLNPRADCVTLRPRCNLPNPARSPRPSSLVSTPPAPNSAPPWPHSPPRRWHT